MTPLKKKRAHTLSLWERVAVQRPGEGLRFRAVMRARGGSFSGRDCNPSPRHFAPTLSHRERVSARNVGCAFYLHQNPVEAFRYILVVKAQFKETVPFDRPPALAIALFLFNVLFAIEFDGQADVEATEVDNEAGDRDLPAKFQSVDTAIAQLRPQNFLSRGLPSAQGSREFCEAVRHKVEFPRQASKLQPLTRRLRRHPLPSGEGYASEQP
jgi:hypothetical protein